ncbi:MAG: HDOD domain-containing protein, partial [Methylomonas sp.]|nr:HDOD domain-containing protein [Methylomonas sp.]
MFWKLFKPTKEVPDQSNRTAKHPDHSVSLASATIIPAKPLVQAQQNLSVVRLKQFAPLRDLDDQTLKALPHATALYPKDAIVFIRDQDTDAVYYLLEGRLQMQPEGDNCYEITEGTPLAALPLNSGKHFGATAVALTDVGILKISAELNRLWSRKRQENLSCVELLDIQLPEEISNKHFFSSFAKAYRENKLRLPSLPNVAFKLQKAMQQDIGINEAVEIIHIDPPIVAKLVQVANSPLYASARPINNCHDAVNRIGLNATRNLVMSISLKQLFKSKDRELMTGMQHLWKNSLYVSSLSFVLAQECSTINPEDALLAGLICDIGSIPLLHFAEQFPDHYPNLSELESSLPYLRGPVGSLVLHTLGFSKELCIIPYQAENWLYDGGASLVLADIVILAKLHSYFGTQKAHGLPFINSIPAYSKISPRKLNPDFSLAILHQAQDRIHAVMQ